MNLSSYKKLIAVGTMLKVENLRFPNLNGVRPVVKVQSNAFVTKHPTKPESSGIWFYWPKASKIKPVDAKTFEVLDFADTGGSDVWLRVEVVS